MRKTLLILAVCLCLSSAAFARDLDKDAQAASHTLRSAPHFALGGVGFAGTISEAEKALGRLVAHKDGAAALEALLKDSRTTMEGRLYSLLGLKLLETQRRTDLTKGKPAAKVVEGKAFAQKVRAYLDDYLSRKAEAQVMRGCILMPRPVSTIAADIRSGLLRLSPLTSSDENLPAGR